MLTCWWRTWSNGGSYLLTSGKAVLCDRWTSRVTHSSLGVAIVTVPLVPGAGDSSSLSPSWLSNRCWKNLAELIEKTVTKWFSQRNFKQFYELLSSFLFFFYKTKEISSNKIALLLFLIRNHLVKRHFITGVMPPEDVRIKINLDWHCRTRMCESHHKADIITPLSLNP